MRIKSRIDSPQKLGTALQQGRLVKGMSQRDLAGKLGIGQKWLWEMEQGKPGIFTTRLFKLLDATGIELYAYLELPDDEKVQS